MPRKPREDGPRIYVACLAAYNAGKLHGAWIDAAQSVEELQAAIAAMLASSPEPSAEEWAVHDEEGFGAIDLGEFPSLEDVARHAAMLEEHGGAWIAYCGNVGEAHATEDNFNDTYSGQFRSPEEYAESLHEDIGTNLGALASYVDWERVARDMGFEGYAFIPDGEGGVYVFSPG